MNKHPELLAPAGSPEAVRAAVCSSVSRRTSSSANGIAAPRARPVVTGPSVTTSAATMCAPVHLLSKPG